MFSIFQTTLMATAGEGSGETPNILAFEPYYWIFYFVTFIALCLILKKILWKPVTEFMDKRTQSIKESIENANSMQSCAEQMKNEYQESLLNARIEAGKIVEDARYRAQKEYNAIVDAAYREAEAFKASTRSDMEKEREDMFQKLRADIAGIALAAASKVIEANMDTERNKEIVNKFIDKEGVA